MADVMNATGLKPWLLKADHTATHYRWRPKQGLDGTPKTSGGSGNGLLFVGLGALAIAGVAAFISRGPNAERTTNQTTASQFLSQRLAAHNITAGEIDKELTKLSDEDLLQLNRVIAAITGAEAGVTTPEAMIGEWQVLVDRPAFQAEFWQSRWKVHFLINGT